MRFSSQHLRGDWGVGGLGGGRGGQGASVDDSTPRLELGIVNGHPVNMPTLGRIMNGRAATSVQARWK